MRTKVVNVCLCCVFVLALVILLLPKLAFAHNLSDGFVSLEYQEKEQEISGQIEIAIRDLEYAIGIDGNGDATVTWGEVLSRKEALERLLRAGISLRKSVNGNPLGEAQILPLLFGSMQINRRSDGAYIVFPFTAKAEGLSGIQFSYALLFDVDPQHRGIITINKAEGAQVRLASPGNSLISLDEADTGAFGAFAIFFAEGVHHILAGYDHMLFLFALLLPAVLIRNVVGRSWSAVSGLRPALRNTLAVITAFTVAHSITLALATAGVVQPPPRLIEALIAVSIIAAAANNLFPFIQRREWLFTFAFGLVHGFGFANVLKDMALSRSHFAASLAGFNIGVEAGQLAIVVTILPILFMMRESAFYRRGIVGVGSFSIASLALVWLIERALYIKVLGF